MALSEIVLDEPDTEFAGLFVQTLNLILLTAKVGFGFRVRVRVVGLRLGLGLLG